MNIKYPLFNDTLLPLILFILLAGTPLKEVRAQLAPEGLSQEINSSLDQCYEISVLKKKAAQLGVAVALGGDTAAYYAHYVKRKAEEKLKKGKGEFHFDYFSIMDKDTPFEILVDKENKSSQKLIPFMLDRFPHLEGKLQAHPQKEGKKESLWQGQIDLSGGKMKPVNSSEQLKFLQTLIGGVLPFPFRPGEADSPDENTLYSLVRYLKNIFRLQLDVPSKDATELSAALKILKEKNVFSRPEIKKWLNTEGPLLFTASTNLASSYSLLEKLGLMKILEESSEKESELRLWTERKPLMSRPLGDQGRTLAELGDFFANASDDELEPYLTNRPVNETKDQYDGRKKEELAVLRKNADLIRQGIFAHDSKFAYEAYRSMARGPEGRPNVLVSQEPQKRDEMAEPFAENRVGLYTIPGRTSESLFGGPRLILQANPDAREGIDFSIGHWLPGEVIFYNREALKIGLEDKQTDRECHSSLYFLTDWEDNTAANLMAARKVECQNAMKRRLWADEDEWKKAEHLFRDLQGPEQVALMDKFEEFLKMGRANYQPDLSVLMEFCETQKEGEKEKSKYREIAQECLILKNRKGHFLMINPKLAKNFYKLAGFSDDLSQALNQGCGKMKEFHKILEKIKKNPIKIVETFRILNRFLKNGGNEDSLDTVQIKKWIDGLSPHYQSLLGNYQALAQIGFPSGEICQQGKMGPTEKKTCEMTEFLDFI